MNLKQQLEELFNQEFESIYKFFYLKTLSKDVAEDLTSDTFVSLAKSLSSSSEVHNLRAYLYGIAKNVFSGYLRKKYQLKQVSIDDVADIAAEVEKITQSDYQLEDLLLEYLDQIPDKQAVVLRLRLIDKTPLSEICTQLSKDMNYVKTTQRRAIITLKKLIACTPLPTNK